MRTVSAILAANAGDGSTGATLDISAHLIDPSGFRQEVDQELTKITPGDHSLKIEDHDGAIWAWLDTEIQGTGRLYPPFLAVSVAGVCRFYGTIDPSRISRDAKTRVISLTAQDWSVMLANMALDTWIRPIPHAAADRIAGETRNVWLRWYNIQSGYAYITGGGRGWDGAPLWTAPGPDCVGVPGTPNNWLNIGDIVTTPSLPGKEWKVIARHGWTTVGFGGFSADGDGGYSVQLSPPGFTVAFAAANGLNPWSRYNSPEVAWEMELHRLARETEERSYYSVTQPIGDVEGIHELPLDTIDGIIPGDTLQLVSSSRSETIDVLQVDPAGKRVISRSELRNLAINDRFFFTAECAKQVVLEDARSALVKAMGGFFRVDLSRYTPPTLPIPVLSWLPLRPLVGADLTSVRDLDAGLSSLRVWGSGTNAWDGMPETGWTVAPAGATPRAVWTDQRTTVPSSLMPDETPTLSPSNPWRFFAWDGTFRAMPLNPWAIALGHSWTWTPTTVPTSVLYDYLAMRRVVVIDRVTQVQSWTGTAWGSVVASTWPGSFALVSMCVIPGGPAGMLLGLTADDKIQGVVPGGAVTNIVTLPEAAKGAVVRSTPWGAWVVGGRGYGKATVTGSTLTLAWIDLIQRDGGVVYPNTFTALDADRLVVMARLDAMDDEGKTVTETYALLLKAAPVDAADAIVWKEHILDGSPITAGALRDPNGRVVGHCGGRLFQVSATLPVAYALERFTPSSMKSMELVEHACQLLHAVAVPDSAGTLHIISRSSTETVIDIQVDQVDIDETRTWDTFFSLIRVSGQNDVYADAAGPTDGGGLLELSNHPMLWGTTGCLALSMAMAAWFGVDRRMQRQTWIHADPDTAAPWESLPPLARIRINGAATIWLVMGLDDRGHLKDGKATVSLVEVG